MKKKSSPRSRLWADLKATAKKYIGVPGKWLLFETPNELALRFLVKRAPLFTAYPLDPGFAIQMTIGKAILDEVEKISPRFRNLIHRGEERGGEIQIEIPVRSAGDLKLLQRIFSFLTRSGRFREGWRRGNRRK